MALQGNGTTGRLYTASTISSANLQSPSFHAFIRNTSVPGTPTNGYFTNQALSIYDSADTYLFGFAWHHTTVSSRQAVFHRSGATGAAFAKCTTSLAANTWYSIGGSYASGNLRVWLEGVNETTTTSVAAFPGAANVNINAFANSIPNNYDSSWIMEYAVWNVELSTTEYGMLALGVCPLLIRPANLVTYWPMVNATTPWFGPATAVAGTINVQPHDRIFYPTGMYKIETRGPARSDIVESVTATDSSSNVVYYNRDITETNTPTYTPTGIMIYNRDITESSSGTDLAEEVHSVTDEVTFTEILANVFLEDIIESVSADGLGSVTRAFNRDVVESSIATDTLATGGNIIFCDITETAVQSSGTVVVNNNIVSIPEAFGLLVQNQTVMYGVGGIILPNPQLGDSENNASEVVVHRTMTNVLYTYARKTCVERLRYDFILGRGKALELETFLDDNAGKIIDLYNHKGEFWKVYVTSAPATFTGKSRYLNEGERYDASIEFQGIRII